MHALSGGLFGLSGGGVPGLLCRCGLAGDVVAVPAGVGGVEETGRVVAAGDCGVGGELLNADVCNIGPGAGCGGLFGEVGEFVGEIPVAAVCVQNGLPLTERTGGLEVGVGCVLGVLAGLFGGPDVLHLFGEFLPGAVMGIVVERLGDPVIAGMAAGEAGGGRGIGEFGLDWAPFLGPLLEQPLRVLDVGAGAGESPEAAGAGLDGVGGFGGDGPVGVPDGP
ncbi:MAG: hypothetical protein ABI429_00665 [Jatrophihabitantaceae bacterium]